MLLTAAAVLCLAASGEAFRWFSSPPDNTTFYNIVFNFNATTCVVKNGQLIINGKNLGNLTASQIEELEQYNKQYEKWAESVEWSIKKQFRRMEEMFSRIFGSEGSFWRGFGLFDRFFGKKAADSRVVTSTVQPVVTTAATEDDNTKAPNFPEVPSFCTADS